jgi:hypothetical protein
LRRQRADNAEKQLYSASNGVIGTIFNRGGRIISFDRKFSATVQVESIADFFGNVADPLFSNAFLLRRSLLVTQSGN